MLRPTPLLISDAAGYIFAISRLGLIFLITLSLIGCLHRENAGTAPIVTSSGTEELKDIESTIKTYRQAPDRVTSQQRNELVERLLGVANGDYISLRNSLLNSRNTLDFIGEVTGTTLSAVSALLGDPDTKSILSTASALTQSTKVSVDKSFFKNTSTEALVAKMDELRAKKRQEITSSEALGMDKYGLEAAFNDVREYDDNGTLPAALLSLNADAAANKKTAEGEVHSRRISVQ